MKYFDSHAHYYDDRFAGEECKEGVGNLLDTLFDSSVCAIVNVGTSPATCRLAAEQASRYPKMFTALGIHPTDGQGLDDPEAALDEVRRMILDPRNKCHAVGEIGFDYHYPDTEKETQYLYFDRQMTMAEELHLPVVIHDRDAHGDTMEMIRRHPGVTGVLHSFSGSAEMAKELVALGWYISFSGTLTFTNARKTKEAALVVPKDRILIETDCPYLAPHPLRGSLNHSGNLVYTNRVLSGLLGISEEDCAELTAENAQSFFGITL